MKAHVCLYIIACVCLLHLIKQYTNIHDFHGPVNGYYIAMIRIIFHSRTAKCGTRADSAHCHMHA